MAFLHKLEFTSRKFLKEFSLQSIRMLQISQHFALLSPVLRHIHLYQLGL